MEYEARQRGEVSDDAVQKVMPAPWARGGSGRTITQILLGMNVAVFIAMAMAGVSLTDPTTQELRVWGANYGPLTFSGQWWRLITYMFLHSGVLHIGFNMWCLWDLGALCESLYGPWTYLAVYFISGVAGGLASVAWHPYGSSVGASGAIFGLAGALIASFKLGEFSLPRTVVSGVLRSVLAFVGINLFLGFVSTMTDNAAHGGGLVAGAIVGALVALLAPDRRHIGRRLAAVLVSAALVGGAWFWVDRGRGFEIRVRLANQLLSENKTEQAIGELQRIARQRPAYVPAHSELAFAYLGLKQYDQAEAELKRVLQLDPQNGWAKYELGSLYLNQNRVAEAKTFYEVALRKNSNDGIAHFGLGLVLGSEGDCPGAIQEYETASRLNTEASGVYYELGKCDLKLKKYDDAIDAFQKEQQQNGDGRYIEAGLAEAYRGKGMADQAQAAERKAAQMQNSGTDE